ncbi:MAG TPA: phosphohistidine phosphatase SixA [Candidatus Didemnitutus sp.]
MNVFLIRHAHAVDGEPDDARVLSRHGRKQIRAMAPHLKARAGFVPVEIWRSPLVRAVQTAERVAKIARVRTIREMAGLRPGDDPRIVARRLATIRKPVAVVGHEPHLSALATLLLGGRVSVPVVSLRKGAMLTLERSEGLFRIAALVSPPEAK